MPVLYSNLLLDHFRHPRNYGSIEAPDVSYEAFNPLCGDRIRIDLKIAGEIVSEARFKGDGCAISMAAASAQRSANFHWTKISSQRCKAIFNRPAYSARPSHSPHSETAWATDNTDLGLKSDKLHAGTVGTLNRSHHKLTTATWTIRERVFFAFCGRQQLFRLNVTLRNF